MRDFSLGLLLLDGKVALIIPCRMSLIAVYRIGKLVEIPGDSLFPAHHDICDFRNCERL